MMNSQTLHAFKKILRLKSQLDIVDEIKQWCRVGIVIDSDVDEIKYLLEGTEDGFKKTEYMTRALQLKANKQTFGIKRLITPLSPDQALELRRMSDFLVKVDYKNMFSDVANPDGSTKQSEFIQ